MHSQRLILRVGGPTNVVAWNLCSNGALCAALLIVGALLFLSESSTLGQATDQNVNEHRVRIDPPMGLKEVPSGEELIAMAEKVGFQPEGRKAVSEKSSVIVYFPKEMPAFNERGVITLKMDIQGLAPYRVSDGTYYEWFGAVNSQWRSILVSSNGKFRTDLGVTIAPFHEGMRDGIETVAGTEMTTAAVPIGPPPPPPLPRPMPPPPKKWREVHTRICLPKKNSEIPYIIKTICVWE